MSAVQKNLNLDLTLHNQNEWELERHSRVMLQTGFGVPLGGPALQDARRPAATAATCYKTRAGKLCNNPGCNFDHTSAPPVQHPAPQTGPTGLTELQQAQAEALYLKQMLGTMHNRATQMVERRRR